MEGAAGAADEAPRPPISRQLLLLGGRLVVTTLLLGGSLVLADETSMGAFVADALMVSIAGTFAMSLVVAVLLPRTRRPTLLAGIQIVWDLGLVTTLVYAFGGAASGFSFLYGVVILAAALTLGSRAAQVTTASALIAFVGIALAVANGWLPPATDSHALLPLDELALAVLRNLVGFVLVGLLAGALAERLRRTGGQLEEAVQSAAGFARLNEDILRSLISGLVTTDLEGVVTRINPAGAALLGGAQSEFEGTSIDAHLPLDPPRVSMIDRGDGEAVRLDGTRFPVGFSCSPLRDAEGAVRGSLVLFQDLTELSQLREKAERAERLAALGRLAAGLAHEIRNPLSSISGSVEMVREAQQLDPEDRKLLSLVLGEVDRLNDLVSTMLEVGKPRTPDPIGVDLCALASEVTKVARPGVSGRVEVIAPADPVRVHADPDQLRQVLWNLVKNALQFSPPGGMVRVEVGWDDDARPCLAVSDEGPGISDEDRAHLFDMFYSRRQHGVGLGLALVRQIVEAHGGAITVESQPGEGATFRVHLPPEAPRAEAPGAEATGAEATGAEAPAAEARGREHG